MTTVQGQTVDVPTPDGIADAYLTAPDDGERHPGVLFYQDGFGVRPSLRAMADRLAGHGYTVLLPNVYYRHGRAPVIDLPDFIDLEQRPEIFQQVRPLLQGMTPDVLAADAHAYLDYLAGSDRTTPSPVGVTGYCMGARLSLATAAIYPDRVAAAAGFHGAQLATDTPDSPHLAVGTITAELYFGHADQDPSLPQEQIDLFEKALTDAGVRHRCEVYPGAHHGYTQTDTAAYDEEASERHWRELVALLNRTLA
ncbi:carboxymethylenebutenolidase [Nocardia transvalensis]|uniref:Carboxymethylenebutenolidase n=1 Tax=Nocardia transvalensis TaxID=37333 RepID=A0A7W9UJS0_9NOCA|nr:dienelactone hydrolase family protein [Nocardia transvalensis]MBB5914955.1 carboxymethylenebutenolidase [Nocardia transvalensis]